MIQQELTYWTTLALMPKLHTKRKMELYINCFKQQPRKNIIDLFEDQSLWNSIGMTEQEREYFTIAHGQLANNAFAVEELLNQGYEIIPVHSDAYSKMLKENLKQQAPLVIFAKGDTTLLQQNSVAIVGSRKANDISLTFTDNVAKKAVNEHKIVISGFAKGVDRQALDSAINAGGKSIIVLPQGITTFATGYKQYYKPINQGNVLVVSTFAPKAPWSVELAMARNPIIYGMAQEIFVAQSDSTGGTWNGVIDGLKKERTIFVRTPSKTEKNANNILIEKGALGVDIYGNRLINNKKKQSAKTYKQQELPFFVNEETELPQKHSLPSNSNTELDAAITNILKGKGAYSLSDIKKELTVTVSDTKLRCFLNNMASIAKIKNKNRFYYKLNQ